MADPPSGRGEGAWVIAQALVLHIEVVQRIKRLTMPRYQRLTTPALNDTIARVHRLCADLQQTMEDTPMPADKYAPLKNRYWTSEGDNGKDRPIHVGIWDNFGDANVWSRRQNETQRQQEWGNGSAGPMKFKPVPIYTDMDRSLVPPHPSRPLFPERQWNEDDDRRL
jgi:hypothetical protein